MSAVSNAGKAERFDRQDALESSNAGEAALERAARSKANDSKADGKHDMPARMQAALDRKAARERAASDAISASSLVGIADKRVKREAGVVCTTCGDDEDQSEDEEEADRRLWQLMMIPLPQLEEMLRARDLEVAGTKPALARRLYDAERGSAA